MAASSQLNFSPILTSCLPDFLQQEYVVEQVLSEFPHFGRYIVTVRTLWLVDRFRFAEVLCSRLSPVATGQLTSFAQLPEIFAEQAQLVAEHCARHGQAELAALFTPTAATSPPPPRLTSGNVWARGSLLPALYEARRLYHQQSDREAAAKVLLEVADTFRKSAN